MEKRIIWSSQLLYNEEEKRQWWNDYCEVNPPTLTKEDVCAKLRLNLDKLSKEEKQALNIITSAFAEADKSYLPEPSEELWREHVQNTLQDERENLNVYVKGVIVAFNLIDTWDGYRATAKIVGCKIKDILTYTEDDADFYCLDNNVCSARQHHDGENFSFYRIAQNSDRASDIIYLWTKCNASEEDINKRTTSLYPYVANIYGWTQETGQEQDKEKAILI